MKSIALLRRQLLETLSSFENPLEAKAMADRLVEFFTGRDGVSICLHPETEVSDEVERRLMAAVRELEQGMPLQYLLSEAWFYGNAYEVNAHTLIPRPETEELVQWALQDLPAGFSGKGVDVCCGTACIGITMAMQRPQSHWHCVDFFPETLAVAERNIKRYGVQVSCVRQDVLSDTFLRWGDSDYDLLLCNPPYVMEMERDSLPVRVKGFEPAAALFVPDNDPLRFYRAVAAWSKGHVRKGGALYFEINEKLGEETLQLFRAASFSHCELKKDMQHKDRMLKVTV